MRISDWSSDVCSSDLPGQRVALPETVANHLLRVLRLGVGDALIVFNGDGFDYHATLTNAERRAAQITVQSRVTVNRESALRSEEHTSELQSLMRISYAVFCLKQIKNKTPSKQTQDHNTLQAY